MPLTPQEFAQKIKQKYPQYKDIDDVELSNKIIAKYPQYKTQVIFPTEKAPVVTSPSYLQQPKPVAPQGTFSSVKQQKNIFTAPLQKSSPSYPGISDTERARIEASKPTPLQEKVGDVVSTGIDIGKNILKTGVDTVTRAVTAKTVGLPNTKFLPESTSIGGLAKSLAVKFGADPAAVEERYRELPDFVKQEISLRYSDDPKEATSEVVNDAINVYSGGAGQVFKGVSRPILRKFLTTLGISTEGALMAGASTAAEEIKQGKSVPEAVKSGFKAAPYGAAFGTVLALPGLKSTAAQKEADAVAKIKKASEKSEKITGKIIQGTKEDISKAQKTFSEIDTKGSKTYQDLSDKIDTHVNNLVAEQDKEFAKYPIKRPVSDYSKTYKSGEQAITVNPVDDALNNLEELYTVTNQPKELVRIKDLRNKASREGLSAQEVNDIGREYGTEFGAKAFNKRTGEALTSVNAQKFENTRTAVKNAAREFLQTNESEILDEKISDALRTKSLIDNMVKKVNALEQKVKKRGLVEKIARSVGRTVDVLSLGSIRGFLTSFLPSNIGNKVMNSIDLEKSLSKNLKRLEVLLPQIDSLSDQQVISRVRQILTDKNATSQLLLPAPKPGAPKFGGGAIPENPNAIIPPYKQPTKVELPARKIGSQNSEMKPSIQKQVLDQQALEEYQKGVVKDVKSEIPKEFQSPEMENQYNKFVNTLKNRKLAFKKEAVQSGDLESLKKSLKNIMPKENIDKMFYSQDMSGDEVLDLFRERILKESPELIVGKTATNRLGIPSGKELTELFAAAPMGFEIQKDENGKPKLVFNQEKAIASMMLMAGITRPEAQKLIQKLSTKDFKEIFKDAVYSKLDEAIKVTQNLVNSGKATMDEYSELLKTKELFDAGKITDKQVEDTAILMKLKGVDPTVSDKRVFTTKKLPAPKKETAPISKELQPLYEEAKKYKSAEEFVKAQGEPVYHQSQSKVPFTEFKQKGDVGYKKAYYSQANEGVYFSPNKELVTDKYGKNGGVVIESFVTPKKKLDLGEYDAMYFDGRMINSGEVVVENFKRSQQGLPELKDPDILLTGIGKKAKNWLEKNGYDAVEGMKGEMWSAPELVVLDKNIIKTKSQLIDIWNKANKKNTVLPPKKDTVPVSKENQTNRVAFHGTQSRAIEDVPRKSNGTMGNAFYLSDSRKLAENFGRDQNVKTKDSTRLLRRPGVYPNATIHSFDLSNLKIKEFKNDAEFFDFAKEADFEKWFRLAGYDGAYIKNRNTYAVYNPEKLKLKRSGITVGKKYN